MDFLLDRFRTARPSVAMIHADRESTYGDLLDGTDSALHRLRDAGIGPGESVVVRGDYSTGMVCLLFALIRNRDILIPLTGESVVDAATVVGLSGAQWSVELVDGDLRFERLNGGVQHELIRGLQAAGDAGLILFSSGSSGTPKAILHNLRLVTEKFRRQRPPMVAIAFLMLDHFGGVNTLFAILSGLGTVVSVPDRSVTTICQAISSHRVEVLPTTPSFLNALVRADAVRHFDLSSLRRITYGTEVMPQATLQRVRDAFPGVALQQTYGLSELGVLSSKSRDDGSLWVQVGGDGFRTKVVEGTLRIRSDFSMVGYLNAADPFDASGWFDTEDVVEVDGDWIRILGRGSDLINVAGQKVYPAEVEQAILALENIDDVAVYGEPHPLVGQVVVARVATREYEDASALKLRIRRSCASRLATYKLPTKVVLTDLGALYTIRSKKKRHGQP